MNIETLNTNEFIKNSEHSKIAIKYKLKIISTNFPLIFNIIKLFIVLIQRKL